MAAATELMSTNGSYPNGPSPFPDPVPPSAKVDAARQKRLSGLTRVALLGVGLRVIVILVELAGVAWSGSSALFVDAIASSFDVMSSLALLAAIRIASRPPDEEHPFGHGRVEPLAGFQLGVFLVLSGGWLAGHYLLDLLSVSEDRQIPGWTWLVPAVAAVLLEVAGRRLRSIGRRSHSPALIAEAAHYRTDVMTSIVAAVTLLGAWWLPGSAERLDLTGGALLSVVMVVLGVRAARENLHQLLDRIPQAERFEQVRQSALKVEGVLDVEKVRIQHAGPDAHVDIDIEVDPDKSVSEAHLITQHVRARIQSDWPFVREVVVHVEPYYAGDH